MTMIGRRFVLFSTFLLIFLLIALNTSGQPILYSHHIVMIQGDDPATAEVEPEDELRAIERFYFFIPSNETWVEVPVPKIARMAGMNVDHVVDIKPMGFIPGEFAEYWNLNNPPYKVFKDMTDMECCIADFYAWGFPEKADRNLSYSVQIGTSYGFNDSIDDERSSDVWNISASDLKLNASNEYGDYYSNSTIMGINITKVGMSWEIAENKENISLFFSVNNGMDWIDVTDMEGEEINFTDQGNEFLWKINMSQDVNLNNTPILSNLWVNVSFIPEYTEIILQLDYVVEREGGKFEYTWDFYEDWQNGIRPHILIYTDLDHKLTTDDIQIIDYGIQEEFPGKEVYGFMVGSYSPETTVTITKNKSDDQFQIPWHLILILIIIVIIILVILLSIPKKKGVSDIPPSHDEETTLDEEQEAEMAALGTKKEGLLKAIKKLDTDFEEGTIDEDVYTELKSGYKQKTIDIMKRMDVLAATAVAAPSPESEVSPEEEALQQEKEKLLLSMKKLDSDYEEGVLDEETYNELRDDYKKKAISVAKELEVLKKE